jgi:hypothetical protein
MTYRYSCGGFANYSGPCGALDCGSCHPSWEEEDEAKVEESTTATIHIASQDYPGIRKGDLYARVTGYSYLTNGPRTGYLRPVRRLVCRAPGTEHHFRLVWARGMARRAVQLEARRRRAGRGS